MLPDAKSNNNNKMNNNFTAFFRQLKLTRDFSDEELQHIIETIEVRTLEPGEVILEEGRKNEGFHFLFTGKAEVWKRSSTSKDHFLIDTLKPGALFGEMSEMTGEPTSASVRAKTVCTVLIIRQPVLLPREIHVKLLLASAHNIIHRLQLSNEKQAMAMAAEAELKVAWNIQKSFLPSIFPNLPKVDIFGACEPAREIGGDYFDVFQIDSRRYGLVIGDFSGKGVPAAIFMSGCRTLFRTLSGDGAYPNEVLRQFNKRLVNFDESASMFITVFYGILDIENGRFIYASAGHNMPLVRLVRNGIATVKELEASRSLVAGVMEEVDYAAEVITLQAGDLMVLYTDGINEAINDAEEEFGMERFAQLVETGQAYSANELVKHILAECSAYQQGRPQFDDMTMLVVKMKG